jgi:hypothetical protein
VITISLSVYGEGDAGRQRERLTPPLAGAMIGASPAQELLRCLPPNSWYKVADRIIDFGKNN